MVFIKRHSTQVADAGIGLSAHAAAQPLLSPPPPPCTPAVNVVCDQQAPEDLVALGPRHIRWARDGSFRGNRVVIVASP